MASNPKNTRKCIVCREHADKSELVRVVKSKDGTVFIDKSGKAEGRGAWFHNNPDCIEKLIKRRGLNQAFRCAVKDEIYEELKNGL